MIVFADDAQLLQVKRDGAIFHVGDTVGDQLKYLKRAVESALDSQQLNNNAAEADTAGDQEISWQAENEQLKQQNVKLRSLLSTKREQIATLRYKNKHYSTYVFKFDYVQDGAEIQQSDS